MKETEDTFGYIIAKYVMRSRNPFHSAPEIPATQFSIFAAAPHQPVSSFGGSHDPRSHIIPATLTHFQVSFQSRMEPLWISKIC